jgi:hypothetical protein
MAMALHPRKIAQAQFATLAAADSIILPDSGGKQN